LLSRRAIIRHCWGTGTDLPVAGLNADGTTEVVFAVYLVSHSACLKPLINKQNKSSSILENKLIIAYHLNFFIRLQITLESIKSGIFALS
jgi:hypothetical protein